jgi:hypothetical protein
MTNGRVWAFAYNLVPIPIARGALYPLFATLLNPKMAAASLALSSVSVVTNSLRLRRFRVPKVARDTAHPPLRARLKGWSYLAGIAALMLALGRGQRPGGSAGGASGAVRPADHPRQGGQVGARGRHERRHDLPRLADRRPQRCAHQYAAGVDLVGNLLCW